MNGDVLKIRFIWKSFTELLIRDGLELGAAGSQDELLLEVSEASNMWGSAPEFLWGTPSRPEKRPFLGKIS